MTPEERAKLTLEEWLDARKDPYEFRLLKDLIASAIRAAVEEEREECVVAIRDHLQNPFVRVTGRLRWRWLEHELIAKLRARGGRG